MFHLLLHHSFIKTWNEFDEEHTDEEIDNTR